MAASVEALVAAYNRLGQRLYERRAEGNEGNIVLSPISIGTALAIGLSGARGDTEREMQGALGLACDRAAMESASGALIAALEAYNRGDVARIGRPEAAARKPDRRNNLVHIAFANALLLDAAHGVAIRPAYRAAVATCYAAEVMVGATIEAVNGWVSAKTAGLVPRLLQTINPNVVACLLNAITFVASWAQPFDATKTEPRAFTLENGSRIEVRTMHQAGLFVAAETDDWRALRLACLPPHLGLVIGLPKDGRWLASIDACEIEGVARHVFDMDPVPRPKPPWRLGRFAVALPRFKIEAASDLVAPLEALGMHRAFREKLADFTGLADKTGVWIGQIRHGASLEVHETGIAAAAATVVEIVERSVAEPFAIDRPFLFFLVDDRTGAVLMRGRVVDPRG